MWEAALRFLISFILLAFPVVAEKVPYRRVPFPAGMAWKTCECIPLHYIGKGKPAKGELRIDYSLLYPGDLTNRPIVCYITNGPPKTTISVKEEDWDHTTFKFDGPGKNKEMEWDCTFVVPKQ
jgi:hypothetical protein